MEHSYDPNRELEEFKSSKSNLANAGIMADDWIENRVWSEDKRDEAMQKALEILFKHR